MSDFFEEFIDNNELSMKNIRRVVDDYSLMSYYLGEELDLNTRYSSPLRRGDDNPSFSMFYGYGGGDDSRLFFKDQSTGLHGDVFDYLKYSMGAETMTQVLSQVNLDLCLGLGSGQEPKLAPTIIKKEPLTKERPKIQILPQEPTKKYIEYWWYKYEIIRYYLDMYNTYDIYGFKYVFSFEERIKSCKGLGIAYDIGGFYKIYQPEEEKSYKFRNDYPSNYVEGHMQLDWTRNDLLVISKSSKENIFFRNHWNIQSVAGKSETTLIPPHIMAMYLNHFKRVVLWLDPDEAGTKMTVKYMEMYPQLEPVVHVAGIREKDPTDIFEIHRKQFTSDLVRHMLKV